MANGVHDIIALLFILEDFVVNGDILAVFLVICATTMLIQMNVDNVTFLVHLIIINFRLGRVLN